VKGSSSAIGSMVGRESREEALAQRGKTLERAQARGFQTLFVFFSVPSWSSMLEGPQASIADSPLHTATPRAIVPVAVGAVLAPGARSLGHSVQGQLTRTGPGLEDSLSKKGLKSRGECS
jgi:hypothetical protein